MDSSTGPDTTKVKDTFIAIASHKLLSPLTIINWNLEILRKDNKLTKKHAQEFSMIEENVKRLEDFSEIMLEISGVVRAKENDISKTVDIKKIFDGLENEYKELISEKNLKIKIDIEKNGVNIKIQAEPRMVIELFRSVFENAIKYSNNDSVIEINVLLTDSSLNCQISNTGIGIPSEEKDEIYESFYRCSNAIRSSIKGYGLSLYLSKKIIEKIKGDINFESLEEGKTRFSINIPIEK